MIRSGVADPVFRNPAVGLRGSLLQGGLPIQAGTEVRRCCDQRPENSFDERAGALQVGRHVHRADHRFHGVGEYRGLVVASGALLPLAEEQIVTKTQGAGNPSERLGVHYRGSKFRELSLRFVRKVSVQAPGNDDAENRIAEELQAFVGRQATVLVGVGTVSQCLTQQSRIHRLTQCGHQLPQRFVDTRRGHLAHPFVRMVSSGALFVDTDRSWMDTTIATSSPIVAGCASCGGSLSIGYPRWSLTTAHSPAVPDQPTELSGVSDRTVCGSTFSARATTTTSSGSTMPFTRYSLSGSPRASNDEKSRSDPRSRSMTAASSNCTARLMQATISSRPEAPWPTTTAPGTPSSTPPDRKCDVRSTPCAGSGSL